MSTANFFQDISLIDHLEVLKPKDKDCKETEISEVDYLEFLEPTNASCTDGKISKISVEDAILSSKEAAHRKGRSYKNDKDALWDFVAEHWAKIVLKKRVS